VQDSGLKLAIEWMPSVMFSIVVLVTLYAVKLVCKLHYSRD
jgi:hypothetical protein